MMCAKGFFMQYLQLFHPITPYLPKVSYAANRLKVGSFLPATDVSKNRDDITLFK